MVVKKRARARSLLCPVQGKARNGPPVSRGLGPTPNQPWGFGGLAAGAGWSGNPIVLVLGLLASVLAPVFHLPSPDSWSAGFHVPGWEHRVRKDAAGSGPLSPCRGSSQLSWWHQLPGSANTHAPLSPATHPSPPPPSLRADHGFWMLLISKLGFPGGSVVKDTPANAGEIRDMGLTPGLGRSPGGGLGNPLQYSCLKSPGGQRSLAGYSTLGGVAKE